MTRFICLLMTLLFMTVPSIAEETPSTALVVYLSVPENVDLNGVDAVAGASVLVKNDVRYNQQSSVNLSGNTFYVRDEQDIRSLAVEIATLTRRQQRGKGLRFTSLLCQRRHAGRLMCLTAIAELFDKAAPEAYATA